MPRSEYFKRQCWISFDPDKTTLPAMTSIIGEDRIVWASDYPHLDATFPGVVDELDEHLEKLPPSARDKLRGANAARLFVSGSPVTGRGAEHAPARGALSPPPRAARPASRGRRDGREHLARAATRYTEMDMRSRLARKD